MPTRSELEYMLSAWSIIPQLLVIGGVISLCAICECCSYVGTELGVLPEPTPTPIPTPLPLGGMLLSGEYAVYNQHTSYEAVVIFLGVSQPGYTNLTISVSPVQTMVGDGSLYMFNVSYTLKGTDHIAGIIDWYKAEGGTYNHITYAIRDGNYDLIKQIYI